MRREKTGYDRHTTEEGCKFAQTILPPPHLKAVWVGKQIMSEVRKEIRERFLSFLFTEIRKGKHMKKKMVAVLLAAGLVISLAACGGTSETGNTADVKTGNEETADDEPAEEAENTEESTLTYGSGDYTRINPAMDEHCEINVLLFNGLTAHDADDQVVPGLAESWIMMKILIPIHSTSEMELNGMMGNHLRQTM